MHAYTHARKHVHTYDVLQLECLNTLETRRLREGQVELFNIVNGYEGIDRNMFFKQKNKDNRTE